MSNERPTTVGSPLSSSYPGQVDIHHFLGALKDARQDKLWSQVDLAYKMGVTPQDVREWEERGGVLTLEQCRRLAKVLGIPAPSLEANPSDEWRLIR